MKTSIIPVILLFISCSTAQHTSSDNRSVDVPASNQFSPTVSNLSLADYLKRIPGVQVSQSGLDGAQVLIRGNNTLGGQREPLFIINGVNVGYGYNNAAPLVEVNDIASVQVLKSGQETAAYGIQGNNGVIVIKTKK